MKRAAAICLLFAGALCAQEFRLGSTVSGFQVTSPAGEKQSFSSLQGPTTVVAFIATKCPVSNAYNERMKALYSDYSAKGVKFIFVNSNSTEPASEVASHSKQVGFPFPVFKDENNVVADLFGAQATPEIYVMDSKGVVRYHGSIDDAQRESQVRTNRLRDALDAVMAGKEPAAPETKAFGCTIRRVKTT